MPPDAIGRWCGRSSRVLLQAVATGTDGDDRDWLPADAQLAPKVSDVDVDDVGGRIVAVAPHRAQNLLAAEDLAGVVHEVREQVELGVGQPDQLTGHANLAAKQ